MTVEERLEKVEREQVETKTELAKAKRWIRQLLVAGAVGLTCAVILAAASASMPEAFAQEQPPVAEVVQARKFVVLDENGRERAVLGVTPAGPCLTLSDENGQTRTALGFLRINTEPGLILYDENGKSHLWLGARPFGPQLLLFNKTGKPQASFSVFEFPTEPTSTRSILHLRGVNGHENIELSASRYGPRIWLANENGRGAIKIAITKGVPYMGIYGEKNNALWKAP